jgi:hypothetical protein
MVISRNKRTDKPAKGYHHTDEAKKRMSLSHKGLIPANKGRTGLSHWGYEQKELARIRGLYRTLTEKGRGIKVVLNEKSYYFVSVRECSKYFLNIESHNAYIEKRLNKGIIRSNTYGIGIRVLKDSVIEYCTVDEILRNRNDLLNYIGGLMCIS